MKTKILITGGAGFIGSNAASYFSDHNYDVTVLDNLSRLGTKDNLRWLIKNHRTVKFIREDIRNGREMEKVLKKGYDAVLHLAAQVAVTTSVNNPREDFEINASGTFNILEAVRKAANKPVIVFSSTNKVYGGMESLRIIEKNNEYTYRDFQRGIPESYPLDFHSPYGCSKGAADQYVRDYYRIYGIPTVVLRQSCVYGPRQFGIEDQGWVAWFIIAATLGKTVTVYGDGKQVRDVLFVEDLVKLYHLVIRKSGKTAGKIYNVGGGPGNILSVYTRFSQILADLFDGKIKFKFSGWRPGDQKVFISNIGLVKDELGWQPETGVEKGISRLFKWVQENRGLFRYFK